MAYESDNMSEPSAVQGAPDVTTEQRQVQVGMKVIGSDGGSVGQVKEIRGTDFLVDCPLARDVYVPFEACRTISDDQGIVLTVPADEVNHQGWANP